MQNGNYYTTALRKSKHTSVRIQQTTVFTYVGLNAAVSRTRAV